MRLFLMTSMICVVASSFVYAETLPVKSRVSEVTVYPGAAVVTRSAEVDIPVGDHTILFENIIPQLNDNALTVKGQGQADVKIFGAIVKRTYLTESANERVRNIQSQIELVTDQRMVLQSKQKVVEKRMEYLDSIRFKVGEQLPKDMQTKMPTALELQDLGQYLTTGYDESMSKLEENRIKLRELEKQFQKLNQDLAQVQGVYQQEQRSIAVDVQCAKPGKMTMMVSYLVNGANWVPNYDARVQYEKSSTELSLFALVSQTTGEDWDGVKLTVSTSRPTLGGQMPELSAWQVSPMPTRRAVYEADYDNRPKKAEMMTNVASQLAEAPMEMDRVGADKVVLNKSAPVSYAQSENKGVSVVFRITKAVDIKSDGASHRVPVLMSVLPSGFEYAATPKMTPMAYLKAGVSNKNESTLLPGQVNIYIDGDYVGNSALNKAIGSNEQFDLFLGADEGVTVKRKLLEKKTDDTMFGGIPSSNFSVSYSYKITVENYKKKPIVIKVYENIPVSTDDKIHIKNVRFSPEPTQKDVDDRAGVMRWTLNLAPNEKKDIIVSFMVEHPKSLTVTGL